MNKLILDEFKLAGLKLKQPTTNENGQSGTDCGNLWFRFEIERYADKIPGKLSDEIYAVYFDYEGDHTEGFSYFIGCKVKKDSIIPKGIDTLTIPEGTYKKIVTRGKMPDCLSDGWEKIWKSKTKRKYAFDFELYDHRSRDWNNAEIDIYLSIN
jgi:predicted transcriptional regulator YdeE